MKRILAVAGACAALMMSEGAGASVRLFTDQQSFLAALSGGMTADFDDLGDGFYGGGQYGPGSVVYNNVAVESRDSYIFSTRDTAYGPGTNLTIQQAQPTRVSFIGLGGRQFNAFGLNISSASPILLDLAGELVTLPVSSYPDFSYVGIITDSYFEGIDLYTDNDGIDLDDVTFGIGQAQSNPQTTFVGGTPDDPVPLTGTGITEVGGSISGDHPERAFVGFDWYGGDFSALGSLAGADPNATFAYSLYSLEETGRLITTTVLRSGNGFSGFLNASLAAGRYSVGFEATSPLDPDWTIRFVTPVAGAAPAVPEPATWALTIAGFGLVGGAMRRRVRAPARA